MENAKLFQNAWKKDEGRGEGLSKELACMKDSKHLAELFLQISRLCESL